MSTVLLDNSVGNFAAWRLSITENVSRLKFGTHAAHLQQSIGAPTFRQPPQPNDLDEFGNFSYAHATQATSADATAPPTTGTTLTTSGQTFFRQDLSAFNTERDKFQTQGLELYEFIMARISPASKLLAKTQPGFSNAVLNNCPHELMKTLESSHQTSSATKSLAALTHLLTIRQNPTVQSHPDLVDQINNAFQQVSTCWESKTNPGFVSLEDIRGAAYLSSLHPATYAAPKERFLAANPDLRGINALQLQQSFQTYTIALDLDHQDNSTALLALKEPMYCPLCYERTKRQGLAKKFTGHGVPGKEPCRSGKATANNQLKTTEDATAQS